MKRTKVLKNGKKVNKEGGKENERKERRISLSTAYLTVFSPKYI
jgi:hypothetical protein